MLNFIVSIARKTSQPLLGRWKITHNKQQIDHIVYLANQDHCGPCGYLYDKNIVNSNEDKKKIKKEN